MTIMTSSTSSDLPTTHETYDGRYRSVAFGTWKVGEARRFYEKYKRPNQRAQSVIHQTETTKGISPKSSPTAVRLTKSLDSKAVDIALLSEEDTAQKVSLPSTSSPSSPERRSEGITKSQSTSNIIPYLVRTKNEPKAFVESMAQYGDADCYSSSEYVQYHNKINAYENVVIGRPLHRRHPLNRSMDALNERFLQNANFAKLPITSHSERTDVRNGLLLGQQTTTFPVRIPVNGVKCTDPTNAWNYGPPSTSYYYNNAGAYSTMRKPHSHGRNAFGYRECSPSASRQFVIDSSSSKSQPKQVRNRAKSLDNSNRFAVCCGGMDVKGGYEAEDPSLRSANALQSARNFLRKLYNSSTLRFRSKNEPKSRSELRRYEHATSPFYEVRLPEPEEIPYLPYNIKYEVKGDNDDAADETTIGDIEVDTITESGGGSIVATGSTTAASSSFSHCSPDEGMFSSEEKSLINGDNAHSHSIAPTLSSPASSSSAYGSMSVVNNHHLPHSTRTPVEQFTNWNDLFSHLKTQIVEIRQRDAHIYNDLTALKVQLDHLKSSS
jgi:hypothetical protein